MWSDLIFCRQTWIVLTTSQCSRIAVLGQWEMWIFLILSNYHLFEPCHNRCTYYWSGWKRQTLDGSIMISKIGSASGRNSFFNCLQTSEKKKQLKIVKLSLVSHNRADSWKSRNYCIICIRIPNALRFCRGDMPLTVKKNPFGWEMGTQRSMILNRGVDYY